MIRENYQIKNESPSWNYLLSLMKTEYLTIHTDTLREQMMRQNENICVIEIFDLLKMKPCIIIVMSLYDIYKLEYILFSYGVILYILNDKFWN